MAGQRRISLKNVCFLRYIFLGTDWVVRVFVESIECIVFGKAE